MKFGLTVKIVEESLVFMPLNDIEKAVVFLGVVFVAIIVGVIIYFCCRGRSTGKRYKRVGSKVPEETSLVYNNVPTVCYPPTVYMSDSGENMQATLAVNGSYNNDDLEKEKEIMRANKLTRDQSLEEENEGLAETVLISPSNVDTNTVQIKKQQSGITDVTLKINSN